jgi:hypothetical protein
MSEEEDKAEAAARAARIELERKLERAVADFMDSPTEVNLEKMEKLQKESGKHFI